MFPGVISLVPCFLLDLLPKKTNYMAEDISHIVTSAEDHMKKAIAHLRTLSIQPWEKNMLQPIERAIIAANIGINPQNDGNQIRLFLPPLTEERRKELVKKCQGEGEHSKVAIRNIRRESIEHIKRLQKNGLSEDIAKDTEAEVQDLTNKFIAAVDKHLSSKEKEIMAV